MVKKIVLIIVSTMVLMANSLSLDTSKSEVYYEAKKDQFFSTYTILGVNKALNGLLVKTSDGYSGELSIDVLSFNSEDEHRDTNVEGYLNVETYKFMTFKYTLHNNNASGIMSINGVDKEISFPVKMEEENGQLYVDGNITIKYTDFGIETPSNFILSAYDELVIGAKLYFNK